MKNKLSDLMGELNQKLAEIEKLKAEIEGKKDDISELCEQLLPIVSAGKEVGKNKFQFDGDWFLIKYRGGRYFIVNFGPVEPASWLRGKRKKKDNG